MAKWSDSYHNGVVDGATAITSLIDGMVLDSMSARDRGDQWRYKLIRTIEISILLELKERINPHLVKEELGYGKKG